jgi:hypothetical protein
MVILAGVGWLFGRGRVGVGGRRSLGLVSCDFCWFGAFPKFVSRVVEVGRQVVGVGVLVSYLDSQGSVVSCRRRPVMRWDGSSWLN